VTATLLSVAGLRQHIETDLPDTALQQVLDAAEDEITRRYGAHATASELLTGNGSWLVLARAAVSITSITETIAFTDTALAADDYRLWPGGRLERRIDGTHGRMFWGDRVAVTYVPVDQTAQRTLVLVQLCKLAIQYSGLKSESVGGDHSETTADYPAERERLLRSLAPHGGMAFA
jgi:hypothetical protein